MTTKVLLVDDDEDMLDCVAAALGRCFELQLCNGGADALRRIEQEVFDVIVLDLMMPDVNGFDVLSTLRERKYPARVVLASALPGLREIAARTSVDQYLCKPYPLDTLERVIRELAAPPHPPHAGHAPHATSAPAGTQSPALDLGPAPLAMVSLQADVKLDPGAS